MGSDRCPGSRRGRDASAARPGFLDELRERFFDSPDDILSADESRLVRPFVGTAGLFPYRTVELVRFQDDAITFDHLSGPFARCHERFQLEPAATGSRIVHTGTFRLRGGLWTAPLAILPVKRAFETHVRQHLEALAAELS